MADEEENEEVDDDAVAAEWAAMAEDGDAAPPASFEFDETKED